MKMFQNDISFITKDIEKEDVSILREIIKELMEEHLKYSIATPFFFIWELENLKAQLPDDWELKIDKTKNIPRKKIRLTISNAYFVVSRHFNMSLRNVLLTGQSIGKIDIRGDENEEDLIAINCQVYDKDKEKYLFELDYARGKSPIRLSITGGESFQNNCSTFDIPGGYGEEDIDIKELSNIDPIIQFVNDLFETYED